ncbi:MAG: sulfotransferase [Sulfitobacter sp.]
MSRLRVINLALPKTGTTTLTDALRHAGLTVADWKIRPGQSTREDIPRQHVGKVIYEDYFDSGDPLARLGEFDAINEMSCVNEARSLWPQTDWGLLSALQRHHEGVKFVLTTRDPAKTADSMMRWNSLGKKRLPQSDIPGMPRGFGGNFRQLEQWLTGHYSFCRRVFADSGNFMEYDIEDPDAQAKLSTYLAIDLPWWGKSNVGKTDATSEAG